MTAVQIPFVQEGNPEVSGFFQVDRAELGIALRHFYAETQVWSRTEYLPGDALKAQDTESNIGFLPWRGPIDLATIEAAAAAETPAATVEAKPKMTKEEKAAAQEAAKAAKAAKREADKKAKAEKVAAEKAAKEAAKSAAAEKPAETAAAEKPSAIKHPDGTIFYRADRNKWIAMWGGIQEAARPTVEACKKFLEKKYGFTAYVVLGEPAKAESTETQSTEVQTESVEQLQADAVTA